MRSVLRTRSRPTLCGASVAAIFRTLLGAVSALDASSMPLAGASTVVGYAN
jgi:hypothetical protein